MVFSMKSARSKACNIPTKVKWIVWERDNHCCIYCGSTRAMPNAHFISRAKGGLGIEENIVTLCYNCHYNYDMTDMREYYREHIENYLKRKYPKWDKQNLIFKK